MNIFTYNPSNISHNDDACRYRQTIHVTLYISLECKHMYSKHKQHYIQVINMYRLTKQVTISVDKIRNIAYDTCASTYRHTT